MKKIALIALLLLTGCDKDYVYGPPAYEKPCMNLPYALRQRNWIGSEGSGSCVHASFVMLLRWQNKTEMADWWKRTYDSGEYWTRLTDRIDRAGILWAGTADKGDVSFLERAIACRRGCLVSCGNGSHVVVLVDLDKEYAYILNNNDIKIIEKIPRKEFLRDWNRSESWGLTVMYAPPPPPFRSNK